MPGHIGHPVDAAIARITIGVVIAGQMPEPFPDDFCSEPFIDIALKDRRTNREILRAMIQSPISHASRSHPPAEAASLIEHLHR